AGALRLVDDEAPGRGGRPYDGAAGYRPRPVRATRCTTIGKGGVMEIHLVDGTYELFRHFFGAPSHLTDDGREVGATRATVGSVLRMLEEGVTHVGVATDHVIESFRNDLWPTYKDGSGVEPTLLEQFPLLEQ